MSLIKMIDMSTNKILAQFGLVRRQLNRLGMIYLKEINIGPKQMLLLRFVNKHGQCTMTDISSGIGSDKASVTRMVNSLVEATCLKLTYNKDDHRVVFVSLGAKAKKLIPHIERIYGQLSKDFAGSLPVGEQTKLLTTLKSIESHLQKTIKESI